MPCFAAPSSACLYSLGVNIPVARRLSNGRASVEPIWTLLCHGWGTWCLSPVISALEPIDRLSLISFSPRPCSTIALDQTKNASWLISQSGTWPTPTILCHSISEFSWPLILYSLNFKRIRKKPCHHAVFRILIAQNLRLSPTAP